MNQLDAVLFDLDGTLIDTAADFVYVLNLLLKEKGRPELGAEKIREQVSNGATAMIICGFDIEYGHPDLESLRQRFLDIYAENLATDTALFPGMDSILKQLEQRAIPWGIVTNKPSRFTIPLLEQLALTERCAVAVCPDQVSQAKPHPEPILKACTTINAEPGNTLYVGDHQRDIEAGKRAGNITAAVSWGYIPSTENIASWQADHIIDDADQLQTLINVLL